MNVCIIGASGYTGRELVSILSHHPHVNLSMITSRALEGKSLSSQIPKLRGKGFDLEFQNPSPEELCKENSIELFFLALPHGTSSSYAIPLLQAGKKVIDLSADFRIRSKETYEEYYDSPHPAPEWQKKAQYALPELYELSWGKSSLLASPGCYPTSILIPLAPLLKNDLVSSTEIVVNSMSGVSGAGRTPSEKLLFCERNENAGAYGLPKHRHLSEIEEQLSFLSDKEIILSFHPHLIPVTRGLHSTISLPCMGKLDRREIISCWEDFYQEHAFVNILGEEEFPETAQVVGTNRVDLSVHADSRTNRYVLCSAEDNLIKGAGGQAIQAMNICQGYEEDSGLS
tara:strand:+ start:2941 stop:3969 length:1029 start_codon:yes stop_codon:yes gene_type:complete